MDIRLWLQKWTEKKKKEVYLSLVIELDFITFYVRARASKWYDGSIGQISRTHVLQSLENI